MDTKAIDKLKAMRKDVERYRNRKANLEGRIEGILSNLKEEYGVDSIEETKELLEESTKEFENMSKRFKKMYNEIIDMIPEEEDND